VRPALGPQGGDRQQAVLVEKMDGRFFKKNLPGDEKRGSRAAPCYIPTRSQTKSDEHRPMPSFAKSMPALFLFLSAAALAQQLDIGAGSIVQKVRTLKAGQYVWAPQAAPQGPTMMIVNLRTQRALLFRNGVPIAATTVSTGRPGHGTPTGVFTVLQKDIDHRSSKYDNAPMPFMQRLTWSGVAMHAGNLPGYPASHGCVRLPAGFAKLLYGVSALGMTVVITDQPTQPLVAPTPALVVAGNGPAPSDAELFDWHPDRSPKGPISIIISAADRRAVVLRNGVIIGSAPVSIDGPVAGAWAYAMRNSDADGQHWVRVQLSKDAGAGEAVPRSEWQRYRAPEAFRNAVAGIVAPGTTIVVTPDSLSSGSTAQPLTVIEADQPVRR
jgi:hypothetical protein